jgi:hypothetical protein
VERLPEKRLSKSPVFKRTETILKKKLLLFQEDSCVVCQEMFSGVKACLETGGWWFQTLLRNEVS